jgi:hypothetical protein
VVNSEAEITVWGRIGYVVKGSEGKEGELGELEESEEEGSGRGLGRDHVIAGEQ